MSRRRNRAAIASGREFKLVWNRLAPKKAVATAWRALWNCLPTKSNLVKRNIISSLEESLCPFCGDEVESVGHLFLDCRGTSPIWCMIEILLVVFGCASYGLFGIGGIRLSLKVGPTC